MNMIVSGAVPSFCINKATKTQNPQGINYSSFVDTDYSRDTFKKFQTDNEKAKAKENTKDYKVNFLRALFSRYTKEQIKEFNTTKQLPKNVKIPAKGTPCLIWNFKNISWGTQKLPEGYELKNDILGFTHVVKEGSKGLFLKKD